MKQVTPGGTFVSSYVKFVYSVSIRAFPGASMTLVGLLPPLCDNGHLLVDGGYSRCHLKPSSPY
jgi:hypothetical protein